MDEANPVKAPVRLGYALAGLEAGVFGALLMMAWLMMGSLWIHRSIWSFSNLLSTIFYGPNAYGNQFLRTSLAGAALVVVLYGFLGVLWGVICRGRQSSFLALIGAIAGLAVYQLFFGYLLPHARPLIALYAPDRQIEVGHMLWGWMLARSPQFARNIAGFQDETAVSRGDAT